MALIFPDIDPVVLQFGDTPLRITWYSLSYVAGILLGLLYIKYLNKLRPTQPPIDSKILDELMTYIILGIIIGGRLGYVLFYDLEYNLANPLNIIKTWEGGMSFHGGLIGVIIASYIYCSVYKLKFLYIMDLLACATPIGLFFGRIANFINAELYGRVTDVSWGVIFPNQTLPRHASQLYESMSEGLILFVILYYLFTRSKIQNYNIQHYNGMLSGIFLLLYALCRILIENYREPDVQLGFIIHDYTMGQVLSLPMMLVGSLLILYSLRSKRNT